MKDSEMNETTTTSTTAMQPPLNNRPKATLLGRIALTATRRTKVVVRIVPSTSVDSKETSSLIGRLRGVLQVEVPSALLGGPGSQNTDLTTALTNAAPVAIGMIMVVAFILLLVVFRGLLIALSSIVFNLIGVAASFGFTSLVFQHAIGASLLGIEHQGFVNAWAPLFFFALLFGLSMDYQLFLLAAIKESRDRTGDARSPCATALPAPASRSPTRHSS